MKTVLITGASGNLGRDVVEHLHQQGYAVLATFGSSREMGMFNHLPQVKTQVVNVLDADSVTAFLDEHEAANLRAAVLLVGGFAMGSIRETDADLLHKMYQLNFLSAFNVVKPLLARFEQQRDGQFILIGARPSLNPDEGKNVVAYALSKTLVFALAELIAFLLSDTGRMTRETVVNIYNHS